jgi:hypothetical protein
MSVTIVRIEKKTNLKTNEPYSVLVVQGKAEVLMSKATGRPYVSCKKATIPCALDDVQASALIGQTLPGAIERIECTPFEVKLPTGKKMKLSSTFRYSFDPVAVE